MKKNDAASRQHFLLGVDFAEGHYWVKLVAGLGQDRGPAATNDALGLFCFLNGVGLFDNHLLGQKPGFEFLLSAFSSQPQQNRGFTSCVAALVLAVALGGWPVFYRRLFG
ncbi:MAG TPA: hypothetical protein VF690_17220 [Hymenobacter sp.]|jgi:hypothetical protein